MIVENFTIAPIRSDDLPRSSAGASPVSASVRALILRPVTSTDPKTGVVSPTNYVEPPQELEAAWNLLTIANAYRSQADQLFDLVRDQLKSLMFQHGLPVRHLYSHAVELYLKAFLRAEGLTETGIRDQRSYGHRLGDLYAACKSRGLTLSPYEAACFDRMLPYFKEGHEEYQFRYFEKSISTADPDLIRAAAHAIASVACAHVDNLLKEAGEQAVKGGKQIISWPKRMCLSVGAGSSPDGKVPVTVSFLPPVGFVPPPVKPP
jgi:hypothetical protein